MRGCIVKARTKDGKTWRIILSLGRVEGRYKQKWVTFHGTKKEAEAKLTELLGAVNGGTFAEPSKITLLEWLRTWLEKSVKPPMRRPATYTSYRIVIEKHIAKSTVALIPLQKLRSMDLERYLADLTGAPGSAAVHHAILHRALRRAVKERLLTVSPATDLERRVVKSEQAARVHCWSATEARRFIDVAMTASPQTAAFMILAFDSGARKAELHGVKWTDIDLESGTITIERQLDQAGVEPVYGPTKTGKARTFALMSETLTALRAHKRTQLELKMRNRTTYVDFGLVFAKEQEDLAKPAARLGQPIKTLGGTRFHRLVAQSGVKRIKFHGVRHTCATLMLQTGTRPVDVAARLGHSVMMLMTTYAHAMPGEQVNAASRLSVLLRG